MGKLKNKYRLTIYNDKTFAELFSWRLSLIHFYLLIIGTPLVLIFIGVLLITNTPIKRILPNSEYQIRSQLHKNALLIDSLDDLLEKQTRQYRRILLVLNGQDSLFQNPSDTIAPGDTKRPTGSKQINYVKSAEDSLLREAIESEERFNVTHGQASKKEELFNLYLFPPVKNGVVITVYEKTSSHTFGIDIAAQKDTHVMATAEGTVINAGWSVENGYTLMIQHEDNLISCYKQNSEILKNIGEHVQRGEVIAILGNTGEKSSGTYLHFELWYQGKSLNPQDFISF